ncbi:DivIVA domain-containing protein [Desulfocapsa sulfexigens DSM 10523]|uniref:DivIVA domain-containing protein n=1 Tax=Desulfocapsa sulfexigens (strain DSM 10523 / SB164P1) TaxID=1167006 RepID=M1NEP4_DESSD|nr:DivIVA domain-containing protein [Desulfocapsa sulfexigens]AGF78179.1 DivIVA domain-containing protein [Desulfocapsa sulfexigens DSM 10523]
MAITPQLIKDQEFQIKFRGCDPLEVRDYLETIADEFFELQQQCKEQAEELEVLRKDREASKDYTGSLETDMEFTRKISEELKDGCAQKEEKVRELSREIEELQLRIADMEQENAERDEEVSAANARIDEAEAALKVVEKEKSSLQNKLEILQEQNSDLKKEEVDFKAALATAQQFAEDLKEKSRIQAAEMIAEAKSEINRIRDEAHEELERLPREIDALKKKKGEVKENLKSTLTSYLETIEVFYPDDEEEDRAVTEGEGGDEEKHEENELFQKVMINDDGSIASEDLDKLNADSTYSGSSMDENVLDSLFREGDAGEKGDDAFSLNDMFNLETDVDKKKSS